MFSSDWLHPNYKATYVAIVLGTSTMTITIFDLILKSYWNHTLYYVLVFWIESPWTEIQLTESLLTNFNEAHYVVGIGDNLDLTAIPTNETSVFQNQPLANSFKTTLDLRLSSTICTGRKIKSKFKHLNFLQGWLTAESIFPVDTKRRFNVARHRTTSSRRWNGVVCLWGY